MAQAGKNPPWFFSDNAKGLDLSECARMQRLVRIQPIRLGEDIPLTGQWRNRLRLQTSNQYVCRGEFVSAKGELRKKEKASH
jgi:hypothetical protein